MSTSFFIFVNIKAATCPRVKMRPSCPATERRRGAKLIVGAALRITNRLHLIDGKVNNACLFCQQ
jgi:hypothetical protein